MADFLWYPLQDLPFIFLVLIIAFTVHEFAHAFSAYKFGDRTAYDAGRVTLNPRVHLDVLGTILLLVVGFGWAKPVPVNRGRFKYPRLMGIVVSAVGPLSNLLIAILGILAVYIVNQTGYIDSASHGVQQAIGHFSYYLIFLNLLLFLFNLIPIPPLDGYRIIQDLVPLKVRLKMDQHVQWGMIIFLLIVFIPALRQHTLDPLFAYRYDIFIYFARKFELIFNAVNWGKLWVDF
ncbi:zinc metalloprotease [Paenibacillus baekrokdamisoli]|uniref:Zinc metalloprotease n=1 Tax=Paenibacillus baekrokdamisoli TaxID=1712516 RepID=A0A3G9J6B9_9BACL|nr:Zn-dependent protease [Paenibacillus baekrokdamisoli]BBH21311.1 zinc metalloprotease [Paenibacillus baekrokdamisoli]